MLSLNHIITVFLSAFSSFGPGWVLMSCFYGGMVKHLFSMH
jgi:hypothetical protein